MAPHIRTVKTASGARAVQIVYSARGGRRQLDHVGSAHSDEEYALLLTAARQQMAAGRDELDLGPAALSLYDVSTLYFETDEGDGFRELGLSKERRIDPQITIGLLTDVTGFPGSSQLGA